MQILWKKGEKIIAREIENIKVTHTHAPAQIVNLLKKLTIPYEENGGSGLVASRAT